MMTKQCIRVGNKLETMLIPMNIDTKEPMEFWENGIWDIKIYDVCKYILEDLNRGNVSIMESIIKFIVPILQRTTNKFWIKMYLRWCKYIVGDEFISDIDYSELNDNNKISFDVIDEKREIYYGVEITLYHDSNINKYWIKSIKFI